MLQGFKRWIANPKGIRPPVPPEWAELSAWALQCGSGLRSVDGEGFVIDGVSGTGGADGPRGASGTAWRLEWGPSQRAYIRSNELRLRADLKVAGDLQLAVMNRRLQEDMESAVFQQYVEGVQTRIDQQTPPEMRWLVMFPRLLATDMGALRANFVAVASAPPWMASWLQGPLTRALLAAPLDASTPVVLMIGRGRLMLRTALADPDLHSLQSWLALFDTAIAEAARVCRQPPPAAVAAGPGTPASGWWASVLSDAEGRG